jgi:hypothetical protein
MKYAKILDGNVVKYPYTVLDLKRDYPNVSFPSFTKDYLLREYGVHPVANVDKPSNYQKNYSESLPVFINNELFQSWEESDASESEIFERINVKWNEVRSIRNSLLTSSDWTQLPDVSLTAEKQREWADYRQELRDITDALNPFDISWPVKPS